MKNLVNKQPIKHDFTKSEPIPSLMEGIKTSTRKNRKYPFNWIMEEGDYHKTPGGLVYHIMASFAEVAIGILYRPKLRSHEASNAPPLMHFGSKYNTRYKGELIPINVADKVAVSFYKDCTPHRDSCPDKTLW